jgi:AcrR family transcriptional regulator
MAEAGRPTRRRVETRQRLIAAADELFREQGTIRVSVETICARAGFTRGAFYSNFSAVDDLFLDLHRERAADLAGRLLAAMDAVVAESDGRGGLDDGVRSLLRSLPPNGEWHPLRTVLVARARADRELADRLAVGAELFVTRFADRIVAFAAAYGRTPVVPAPDFARAVIAAHVGAIGDEPLDDDSERTQHLAVLGVIRGLTEVDPEAQAPGTATT